MALYEVAADLRIDIETLQEHCRRELEHGLDSQSHAAVHEFATRHKLHDLQQAASRFATPSLGRDEIAKEKIRIGNELQQLVERQKEMETQKAHLERQLQTTEQKWQDLLQEQQRALVASRKAEAASVSILGQDREEYPSEAFKRQGGVGHIILGGGLHMGSAKYGTPDRSDDFDDFDVTPPPPPDKEHYEKYGIVYSHSSLELAIKEANPGDRIYFEKESMYTGDTESFKLKVKKDLEILSTEENPEETVLYLNDSIRVCGEASLRIANITLRHGTIHSSVSDDDVDPLITVESENAKLFLDNCVLDMGTLKGEKIDKQRSKSYGGEYGRRLLHKGVVSGIQMDQAAAVFVRNCSFTGGCGASILFKYCPFDYAASKSPMLDVRDSTFSNTGSLNTRKKKCELPSPQLAVIELWRIIRKEERKVPVDLQVRLHGNSITNNFQAAVGYRTFYGSSSSKKASRVELVEAKAGTDAGPLSLSMTPFAISFSKNLIKSNGLGLEQKAWANTDSEDTEKRERNAKKRKVEKMRYPDGEAVLSIHNIEVDMYSGSRECPYYMFMGEPCKSDYYRPSSDESGGYFGYY